MKKIKKSFILFISILVGGGNTFAASAIRVDDAAFARLQNLESAAQYSRVNPGSQEALEKAKDALRTVQRHGLLTQIPSADDMSERDLRDLNIHQVGTLQTIGAVCYFTITFGSLVAAMAMGGCNPRNSHPHHQDQTPPVSVSQGSSQ